MPDENGSDYINASYIEVSEPLHKTALAKFLWQQQYLHMLIIIQPCYFLHVHKVCMLPNTRRGTESPDSMLLLKASARDLLNQTCTAACCDAMIVLRACCCDEVYWFHAAQSEAVYAMTCCWFTNYTQVPSMMKSPFSGR